MRAERMLVDSGADVSLIAQGVGVALGMRLRRGERFTWLHGAGGGRLPVVYRQVRIGIGDFWVRTRVGWVQDESPLLVLGRRDVFRHFSVELREFEHVTVFRHVSELL